MTNPSNTGRFGNLLKEARSKEHTEPAEERALEAVSPPPAVVVEEATRPVRIKRGERSNPDYEQTTAYVPRKLYSKVKIRLLQEGRNREYSDLVEKLLSDWLSS